MARSPVLSRHCPAWGCAARASAALSQANGCGVCAGLPPRHLWHVMSPSRGVQSVTWHITRWHGNYLNKKPMRGGLRDKGLQKRKKHSPATQRCRTGTSASSAFRGHAGGNQVVWPQGSLLWPSPPRGIQDCGLPRSFGHLLRQWARLQGWLSRGQSWAK